MLNKKDWVWHEATELTAPKYAAIRAAAATVDSLVERFRVGTELPSSESITDAVFAFAQVIDAEAPDGAHKNSAIRCCQLVRNALNEARVSSSAPPAIFIRKFTLCLQIAEAETLKARWQACAAVAFT